jgi:hypothetical protein
MTVTGYLLRDAWIREQLGCALFVNYNLQIPVTGNQQPETCLPLPVSRNLQPATIIICRW